MESERIDAIKEYLKYYVSYLGFCLTSQIKSTLRLILIAIQAVTISIFVILGLIFKDNQIVINYIALVSNIIVWGCLFLSLGIAFTINKIRKKNQPKFDAYYKYLDDLFSNRYGEEMSSVEDGSEETSKND